MQFITWLTILATLVASYFTLQGARQDPGERRLTMEWFEQIWQKLAGSWPLKLPERLLNMLLGAARGLVNLARGFRADAGKERYDLSTQIDVALLLISTIVVPFLIGDRFGPGWGLFSAMLAYPYALGVLVDHCPATYHEMHDFLVSVPGALCNAFNLLLIYVALWLALQKCVAASPPLAVGAAVLLAPLAWSALGRLLDWFMPATRVAVLQLIDGELNYFDRSKFYVQDIAVTTLLWGWVCTPAAVLLGRFIEPQAPAPLTAQMVLASMITSAASFYLTVRLLGLAGRRSRWLSLPETSAVIVVAVSGLAAGSLWLGLWGSGHEPGWKETLSLLIGRSADGSGWSFGPLFWVLHIALLPVLLYLVLLLLAWLPWILIYHPCRLMLKHDRWTNPLTVVTAWIAWFIAVTGMFAQVFLWLLSA